MNYRYQGPVAGVNLADDTGEVVLIAGRDYALPTDHPAVLRLQASGLLTPLAEPETVKKGAANGR